MANKLKNIFTIKRIFLFVLFVSLAGNACWLGTKWMNKERMKYYNSGVMYVFQKAAELGKVNFTDDKGQKIELILPSQCPKLEKVEK